MRIVLLFLLSVMISCNPEDEKASDEMAFFDLSGMLEEQVGILSDAGAKLEKETNFDRSSDHDVTYPDSSGWRQELNTIIGMDINKPVSIGMYDVVDGLEDETSNLTIQHTFMKDSTGVGVTDIKVYYFSTIKNVRRIEITKKEKNPIYHSSLGISMDFGSHGEGLILESFNMQGYQKMIFMDSSTYRLNGIISL